MAVRMNAGTAEPHTLDAEGLRGCELFLVFFDDDYVCFRCGLFPLSSSRSPLSAFPLPCCYFYTPSPIMDRHLILLVFLHLLR